MVLEKTLKSFLDCKEIKPVNNGFLSSYNLRYEVKIKKIEVTNSISATFKDKQRLDVCPNCMKKFVEFVNSEVQNG